jgi:hypothetical protein
MAHGEALFGDELLHLEGKAEQAQHVRDSRSILAGALGDLLVREAEFAVKALESVSNFDGIEVLALDVLNEGDFHEAVVGEFLDDDGDLVEAGNAGCPEAALAGDKLVSIAGAADNKGLDDAVLADGLSKLLKALRGERGAGLEGIRVDRFDGDAKGAGHRRLVHGGRSRRRLGGGAVGRDEGG